MSGRDSLVVALAEGLQLVVLADLAHDRGQSASVWQGCYPDAKRISTAVFAKSDAHVAVQGGDASLWLGETLFDLPWLELLKVADFLRLPIDVPAAEMVEASA